MLHKMLLYLLAIGIIFLMFSFIINDINPFHWEEGVRVVYVLSIIILPLFVYDCFIKTTKK